MRPLGVATKWPAVILYIQWTLAQTTVYERNTLGLVVQEENDPPGMGAWGITGLVIRSLNLTEIASPSHRHHMPE